MVAGSNPAASAIDGGDVNSQQLDELCEYCKVNPNYQHRDLTWAELEDKIVASFKRLTEERQAKVFKLCEKYGVPLDRALRYRFMAQTNLFFLCKLLEKYPDMTDTTYVWTDGTTHNTHEEICNAFFVRKDPTIKKFKDFAIGYGDKRERLLLVPRGGFKSTMNMVDCIQYIINWPEVTILILTGVLNLAEKFVGEVKGHFTLTEGTKADVGDYNSKKGYAPRQMEDESRSLFQVLFPEHCIAPEDGKAYEYRTPAVAVPDKEPTIFAASIEQSLVGLHVGVLKLDDVVTNENSLTVERLKAVNKQVSINQAMLHPYGFYDKIGTWYDSADTYGQDIKNAAKYNIDGETFPMHIYIRPAWWPTLAAKTAGKIPEEMAKADYELWFHYGANSLTYEFLRDKCKNDPYFAIKYLNDPTQMHVIKFPRELLIRRTCQAAELPAQGLIVTCVDTAYSTKSWADYTVIITALIYGGRFYILDMKRGRYNEYELPVLVAGTALQWKPKTICIEDSVGVKWLGREINREMAKLRYTAPLRFVSLGLGSKATSKVQKAKPIARFLGDDRLRFVNMCPGLEELYDELSKFGTAESTHDDIVSALSILLMEYAAYADMDARMSATSPDFVADPKAKAKYDLAYGLGKYAKFNTMSQEHPDLTPQEVVQAVMDADRDFVNADPLADLF